MASYKHILDIDHSRVSEAHIEHIMNAYKAAGLPTMGNVAQTIHSGNELYQVFLGPPGDLEITPAPQIPDNKLILESRQKRLTVRIIPNDLNNIRAIEEIQRLFAEEIAKNINIIETITL